MKRPPLFVFAALLAAATLALAACAGGDDTSVATPAFDDLTAAPAGSAPTPGEGHVAEPAPPSGDAARGEELFASSGCAACHSTGDDRLVGPGLKGVGERAAGRVPGLDAAGYLARSITDPSDYVVEGYPDGLMPKLGNLSGGDVDDLVAYLATLK